MMIMMVQMPMLMVIMNNLLEKSIALPLFSHHTLLGCTLLGPPGQDGDDDDHLNQDDGGGDEVDWDDYDDEGNNDDNGLPPKIPPRQFPVRFCQR